MILSVRPSLSFPDRAGWGTKVMFPWRGHVCSVLMGKIKKAKSSKGKDEALILIRI